jgi:hypothetical protein
MLKTDIKVMSVAGFECIEKYFNQINIPVMPQTTQQQSAPAPANPTKTEECPNFLGLDYLWSIALEVMILQLF